MCPSGYQRIERCRICRSESLYDFLELGDVPPVNAFKESADSDVEAYPLIATVCRKCSHVQLRNTVDRAALFDEYPYFSSASDPLRDHFARYAEVMRDEFLSTGDLVVEIGCNDGLLLRQFGSGIRTIGVEPAENVAEVARDEHDLHVYGTFFDSDLASEIVDREGRAAAVLANNVVGHVDDLHDFVHGVASLLEDDGVFVMEVPYLVDLFADVEFDTIYHEHISYFAIRPLQRLVRTFDLEIFDVNRLNVHGGSIRVYIQSQGGPNERRRYVDDLVALESTLDLDDQRTYDSFAEAVKRLRSRLQDLLSRLGDVTVVGYGAPAKGNVLLNYCEFGPETLAFITDTTPAKQQTYTPGTNIPVRPPEAFSDPYPDYALLLAWNYRETILEKEAAFRDAGGRFIVPQPSVDVV